MNFTMKKIGKGILRFLIVLLITILFALLILLITVKLICSGISQSAKELYATTMLETGQLKFMATFFMSAEELQEIVNKNSVKEMTAEMDKNLINVNSDTSKDMSKITFSKPFGVVFEGVLTNRTVLVSEIRVLRSGKPSAVYNKEGENLVMKLW